MAESKRQIPEQAGSDIPAQQPKDDYTYLADLIADASGDPERLRELLSAIANADLQMAPLPPPAAEPPKNARNPKTLYELEQSLLFERAGLVYEPLEFPDPPPSEPPEAEPEQPPVTDEQRIEWSFEPVPNDHALVMPPQSSRTWLERREWTPRNHVPAFLDPSIRVSMDAIEYAPVQRKAARSWIFSLAQIAAVSAVGVALYVGIAGWVQMGQQVASLPAPSPAAAPELPPAAPAPSETVGRSQVAAPQPPAEPQPSLPFPLPKSYGVFAVSNGQLAELAQLPIKIPVTRVPLSAEITKPSNATIAGNNLIFVIYRRELLNNAPHSASVRVVARVQRNMKFVDGKAIVTPVDGTWRVRDKSYEFRVSPLESNREIVVIQPDAGMAFPPGRYALVLNGYGYDFTVAGPVTAPEQCLEQAQVMDGVILTECRKS